MIKVIDTVNYANLTAGYRAIENNIQWTDGGRDSRQSGVQYKTSDESWTSSVGRSKGKELTYDLLNPYFKDTIFETLINQYHLKRTRLMWVGAKTCYSMHSDSTPRIHIPIFTNPDCYFIFKHGVVKFLETPNVYWVDTRSPHTFVNCSDQPRLHLVGVVNY